MSLLNPARAILLVVDVQERFVPAIFSCDALIQRVHTLLKVCARLDVPVIVSEQYPKGLGRTVPALLSALPPGTSILEKTAFGCGADPAILSTLTKLAREQGRDQIIICGIEAHVCVNQTVHQMLEEGFEAHLMRDAIASRNPADAETAWQKMTQSGAIPSCTEMALFELLGDAVHPAFKELQALVK